MMVKNEQVRFKKREKKEEGFEPSGRTYMPLHAGWEPSDGVYIYYLEWDFGIRVGAT